MFLFLPINFLITFESTGWLQPPLTWDSHLSDIAFLPTLCKSTARSRRKATRNPPKGTTGMPAGSSSSPLTSLRVGVGLLPGQPLHGAWIWGHLDMDVGKSGGVGRRKVGYMKVKKHGEG